MSERSFCFWVTVLFGVLVGMLLGSVGRLVVEIWPESATAVMLAMLAPVRIACSIALRRWGPRRLTR